MPPSSARMRDSTPPERTPERAKSSRPPRTTPKRWTTADRQQDDRSKTSDGSGPSAATPSSVLVGSASTTLQRELSDLSGSYLNGNSAPRGGYGRVPHNVYPSDQSNTSYHRPWRQAKILSSRGPQHPQPPPDCDDGVVTARRPTVVVDRLGLVEVVEDNEESAASEDGTVEVADHRAPIIILLMDPGRKVYELMQLWIDVKEDTVRDVLHAVQVSLGEWRQDYDGIFQVRNREFGQLIHILNVYKYDVQPYELWVAKPWSMSAKATVEYAVPLLNHLMDLKILQTASNVGNNKWKFVKGRPEETLLTLSSDALSRIYVPSGIFKHHHAFQFLSFAPSFEHDAPSVRVDVLASGGDDGSASHLSDSHGGLSTAGSDDGLDLQTVAPMSMERRSARSQARESAKAYARNRSFEAALHSKMGRRGSNMSETSRASSRKSSVIMIQDFRKDLSTSKGNRKSTKGGFFGAISSLSCRGCKRSDVGAQEQRAGQPQNRGGQPTTSRVIADINVRNTLNYDQTSVGTMWRVWEEGSRGADDSVVSESAPLLKSRRGSAAF